MHLFHRKNGIQNAKSRAVRYWKPSGHGAAACKLAGLLGDVGDAVVEDCLLVGLALLRNHADGLGGADGDALAAAHAPRR